jgi:hypothetical protein
MYCDDYKKLMIEFFDTGLKEEQLELLNQHLENCNSCKSEFEELKKFFLSLEKENQTLLIESEKYIQSIDVDEIISKKKNTKWFEFQFKLSFALAVTILISLVMYFSLTNPNRLTDKDYTKEDTSIESSTTDFLSEYFNQDYLYENVDATILPQSNYFNDVINFIDELQYSLISNFDTFNGLSSEISKIDEDDMDEIISQLENKKFLGE